MSLFSISVQTRWFHSSLWLNRTSLYVLNTFSLCLQAYLGWFSNLTIMSMAITQAGNYLYCFWLWFLLTFLFFKEAEFYLMIVLVPLLNFWEYNLINISLFPFFLSNSSICSVLFSIKFLFFFQRLWLYGFIYGSCIISNSLFIQF